MEYWNDHEDWRYTILYVKLCSEHVNTGLHNVQVATLLFTVSGEE